MHGEVRVKKVRQVDTVGFRSEPEPVSVSIKAPGQAAVYNLNPLFIFPIEELAGKPALGVFKGYFQHSVAMPFNSNNSDRFLTCDTQNTAADGHFFKPRHWSPLL
jgi:hypothetical protein